MVATAPAPTARRRRPPDRPLSGRCGRIAVVVLCLAVTGSSACGDDEAASPVCEARDELASSIGKVVEVDMTADGPEALADALDDVRTDLDDLGEVASDELGDEVEGLRSALSDLEAAVGTLDEQSSAADAIAVVGEDLTSLVDAGRALGEAVQGECE